MLEVTMTIRVTDGGKEYGTVYGMSGTLTPKNIVASVGETASGVTKQIMQSRSKWRNPLDYAQIIAEAYNLDVSKAKRLMRHIGYDSKNLMEGRKLCVLCLEEGPLR